MPKVPRHTYGKKAEWIEPDLQTLQSRIKEGRVIDYTPCGLPEPCLPIDVNLLLVLLEFLSGLNILHL